jgi:hypothetical protein
MVAKLDCFKCKGKFSLYIKWSSLAFGYAMTGYGIVVRISNGLLDIEIRFKLKWTIQYLESSGYRVLNVFDYINFFIM